MVKSRVQISVESLSMDLLRTALALHRGSFKMADRFRQEALERYKELQGADLKDAYLNNLLAKMKKSLESEKEDRKEDILMYSVLFQNFALTHFKGG